MARPLRLEFPGALYHVTARGNERRAVFRDDEDRHEYLSRISEYRIRFEFQFLAYCLMTNHVHLAIRTGRVPLSRIMAGLHSTYAQWFNRRHRRTGHLFQGRYKAFLVQEDRYLIALIRYVHRNPVAAGVVERASEYPWSSDRFYRRGKGPSWLDLAHTLPSLGPTPRSAARRYISLIDGASLQLSYEDLRAIDQIVKGDESFALRRFEDCGPREPLLRGLSLDRAIAAAAREFAVPDEHLVGPRIRDDTIAFARCVTAHVAKRLGGISISRVARRFHLHDSSLARPLAALEAQTRADPALRARIDRIVAELRAQESSIEMEPDTAGGRNQRIRTDPNSRDRLKSKNQD